MDRVEALTEDRNLIERNSLETTTQYANNTGPNVFAPVNVINKNEQNKDNNIVVITTNLIYILCNTTSFISIMTIYIYITIKRKTKTHI